MESEAICYLRTTPKRLVSPNSKRVNFIKWTLTTKTFSLFKIWWIYSSIILRKALLSIFSPKYRKTIFQFDPKTYKIFDVWQNVIKWFCFLGSTLEGNIQSAEYWFHSSPKILPWARRLIAMQVAPSLDILDIFKQRLDLNNQVL